MHLIRVFVAPDESVHSHMSCCGLIKSHLLLLCMQIFKNAIIAII